MNIFQISAGFLLFPVTYQVEAESRKRRAAPEAGPGSEAGLGLALRSIQGLVARLDCVEVARCEVAQLAQSSAFPTMAAMISPFVPAPVITRSEDCTLERDEAPKHFLRRTAINSPHFLDFMV